MSWHLKMEMKMEKLTIMSRYRSESCFCHSLLHVWFLQGSIFTVPVGICEECLQGFHKRSPKDVKCSTCRFSLRTEKIGNRRDRVFFTECRACKFKLVSLLSLSFLSFPFAQSLYLLFKVSILAQKRIVPELPRR